MNPSDMGQDNIDFLDDHSFFSHIVSDEAIMHCAEQLDREFKDAADRDSKKKSVVLLEYPRKGIWAVGFATKENEGLIKNKVGEDIINVFVPTTPNPTSGFLLMVPKKELIFLDVSFEQASKFIVSAGTTNIN